MKEARRTQERADLSQGRRSARSEQPRSAPMAVTGIFAEGNRRRRLVGQHPIHAVWPLLLPRL